MCIDRYIKVLIDDVLLVSTWLWLCVSDVGGAWVLSGASINGVRSAACVCVCVCVFVCVPATVAQQFVVAGGLEPTLAQRICASFNTYTPILMFLSSMCSIPCMFQIVIYNSVGGAPAGACEQGLI